VSHYHDWDFALLWVIFVAYSSYYFFTFVNACIAQHYELNPRAEDKQDNAKDKENKTFGQKCLRRFGCGNESNNSCKHRCLQAMGIDMKKLKN
jgi:hypothetical protein